MQSLSCEQSRLLFSDLLAGDIEPADADSLEAHLAHCNDCRAAAKAYTRLHRAMSEKVAHSQLAVTQGLIHQAIATAVVEQPSLEPVGSTAPAQRGRAWSRVFRLVPLAAAVLLVVGLVLLSGRRGPTVAQVAEVEGEVYVIDGKKRLLVAAGGVVRAGDGIQTVGEDSRAVIVFADQTRLEVGAGSTISEITDPADTGKRIFLTQGFVSADVAKQPEGRPMQFRTPDASVAVAGNKVSLVHATGATRIDLDAGSVQVTRQSDGQSVELAAGDYALVRADAEIMAPRRLPPQITTPRASLTEQANRVLALTIAPDGKTLAWGCSDGSIKFSPIPVDPGDWPSCIAGHMPYEIRALAYSSDGKLLASGSDEFVVKLWDPATLSERSSMKVHRTWIEALAFSPDGATLAIAGAHGQESAKIRLWDMATEKVRATVQGHQGGTWGVAFTPDGKTLATVGRDGTAKVWDPQTGTLRMTLTGHEGELLAVAFSPDGSLLATTSRDRTVKLWDVATGQERATLIGHSHDIRAVAFSPDGTLVASGSQDGTVKLWDLSDAQEVATFKGHGGVWTIAFSPDGKLLASGGSFKSVKVWDVPRENLQQ